MCAGRGVLYGGVAVAQAMTRCLAANWLPCNTPCALPGQQPYRRTVHRKRKTDRRRKAESSARHPRFPLLSMQTLWTPGTGQGSKERDENDSMAYVRVYVRALRCPDQDRIRAWRKAATLVSCRLSAVVL